MSAEVGLRWAATATFLAVAGYCIARLAAAHRAPAGYPGRHRAVDVAHVLMGVGMAAMASPMGGPLPPPSWQTIFLLLGVWFAGSWWRERRTGQPARDGMDWHCGGLHHSVGALAMLYMLAAMPHAGHDHAPWLAAMPRAEHHSTSWLTGGPGMVVVVGWALVAYFLASALFLVVRTDWRPASAPSVLRAPRLTTTCQATMALGNGYLLLVMLG